MNRKLLGKVLAGAGLGAASLLICAPGTALADEGPRPEPRGHVWADPDEVRPGHKVKITLECDEELTEAHAWSEATGRVNLKHIENWREDDKKREYGKKHEHGKDWENAKKHEDDKARENGWGGADDQGREEGKEREKGKEEGEEREKGKERGEEREKAHYFAGEARVENSARPGPYEIHASCDAEGELVVLPKGHVPGGDGGATTDTTRMATGAGMLGAASVGGVLLMRRRRINGSLV